MEFSGFFNRTKIVDDIKEEAENTDHEIEIRIGQKLFAKNGETVTVCMITEKTIIVEYKQKKHERDKSVVGKTLFVANPLGHNTVQQQAEQMRQELLKVKQQEQLEIQKRKEEERKRQEQEEIQRKKDAERRIQERLELEKKQEEERRIQEQLRLEKIKEMELSGWFKENETPLYHEMYGEGVFFEFESSKKYIRVSFNSGKKIIKFLYPNDIGKSLFIQKPDKLLRREEFLKNPENKKEDLIEQEHFVEICEIVDKNLKNASGKEQLIKYGYNNFSDSYDSSIFQNHQVAMRESDLWRKIRSEPYFARVDHGENLKFYIGKNAIHGLVVDWRDKISKLYYQYNIYVGNEEWNLSLVRDFDVAAGIYLGFVDTYSRKGEDGDSDVKDNVMSDERLLKVIRANRGDKKIHDIIQTIQKNQYEIITRNEWINMLVLGCAGSGKTMIMLHRLSYMVFNNHNLDIKNIYILSPTRLLNLENDELSRTLSINSANRLAIGVFHANLIKQYYKQNNVFMNLNFQEIISNSVIDSDLIKFIYSESFIETFKRDIIALVLSNSEKREKFIELENARIRDEYRTFFENGVELNRSLVAFAKNDPLHLIYENVKKIASKVPLENAIAKLNKINRSLNLANSSDTTLKGKKEVLERLITDWDLSNKTIYTVKNNGNEVSIANSIFSEVFRCFDALASDSVPNQDILSKSPHLRVRYSSVIQLLSSYQAVVEKIKRFEQFVNRSSNDYLSEIIGQLISEVKKDNQIDCKGIYEFEVFLHLVGCSAIFGGLHHKRTLLFVDEFQDYAFTEISLYKHVFPNAVFNLFGDIKQSINPKGMNEDQVKQVIDNHWMTFDINENYRNAHQITEFINSEFCIDMMPVGIDGFVKYCAISELRSEIKLNNTDRIALIIKDIAWYERIQSKYLSTTNEEVNVIRRDECEVRRGCLNVIPVSLAKGLEFETVYVLPYQMTQNEKYVAYTRALNELYVIDIH